MDLKLDGKPNPKFVVPGWEGFSPLPGITLKPMFKVGDEVYFDDTGLKVWTVSDVSEIRVNGRPMYNLVRGQNGLKRESQVHVAEERLTATRINIPPVGNMTEIERLNKLVEVLQNEKAVITKC